MCLESLDGGCKVFVHPLSSKAWCCGTPRHRHPNALEMQFACPVSIREMNMTCVRWTRDQGSSCSCEGFARFALLCSEAFPWSPQTSIKCSVLLGENKISVKFAKCSWLNKQEWANCSLILRSGRFRLQLLSSK